MPKVPDVHRSAITAAQLCGRCADMLQRCCYRGRASAITAMAYRETDPARRGDPVLRMCNRAGRRAAVQVPVQHILRACEQPLRRYLYKGKTMPEWSDIHLAIPAWINPCSILAFPGYHPCLLADGDTSGVFPG